MRHHFSRILATAAIVVSGGCRHGGAPSAARPAGEASVVHVVDGDTIIVTLQGMEQHVRLIGINTPETVKPNWPVECYGPEASKLTKSLLPPGTVVRLVRDVEARDAYDRLLAYVYRRDDDLFINLELARQGDADEMSIRPNTAHQADFRAAVAEARDANRGLWRACSH